MLKVSYSWRHRLFPNPKRTPLVKLVRQAAQLAGLPDQTDWEIVILFVDDRRMAQDNMDYVGHEGTTDVITFCYFESDQPVLPGEVGVELIICPDAARREGEARPDSDYASELVLYIVHGLLHSAGYDDLTSEAEPEMRRMEKVLMKELALGFNFSEIFPAPTVQN